jgi:hypothetical protein
MLLALALNVATPGGKSCTANVPDVPPPLAVIVADCEEVTAAAVAAKLALVAFAGTVTDAGTVKAESLLARLIASPPDRAAAVRFTVQASDPAADIEALVQDTVLTAGAASPTAVMLTTTLPWDELLVIVRIPVNVFVWGDVNCKVTGVVCPGLRVNGVATPDALNNDPATDIPVTVTGTVPVELSVMVWVAVKPATTLPKLMVVALETRVGIAAFN